MGEVNQWLCGCVVSILKVSNFQNEANKILKKGTVYYTSMGLFCATFRESSLRSEVAIQLPRGTL
jgi:hypothetical protein